MNEYLRADLLRKRGARARKRAQLRVKSKRVPAWAWQPEIQRFEDQGLTQTQIGIALGMTERRIRQIKESTEGPKVPTLRSLSELEQEVERQRDLLIGELADEENAEGYIYFMQTVGGPYVKIGWSISHPATRLERLQTGCPFKLRLLGWVAGRKKLEGVLQKKFDRYNVIQVAAYRGDPVAREWFFFAPEIEAWMTNNTHFKAWAKGEA